MHVFYRLLIYVLLLQIHHIFVSVPSLDLDFQRCMSCFFLCSMSSAKMSSGWLFVLLILVELMTITFINTIYTFNASKMTSYPMWWPHSKTRPYNLCDDLIPRHDLIIYVMTSLQDVTFKLMWWPNSKTWLYNLCDDIIPRHDLITYVLAIGLFLHTIKNKSNPQTRIYFHALVTFIINY